MRKLANLKNVGQSPITNNDCFFLKAYQNTQPLSDKIVKYFSKLGITRILNAQRADRLVDRVSETLLHGCI